MADEPMVKMLNRHVSGPALWAVLAMVLLGPAATNPRAEDITFDTLQIGTQDYTNLIVLSVTSTDIFIQHASGLANFKIQNLDPQVLAQLTGQTEPSQAQEQGTDGSLQEQITAKITEHISDNPEFQKAFGEEWQPGMEPNLPQLPTAFIAGFIAVMFIMHLFFSYCAKLIVEKTGQEAGFLVWLPILQMFPLLRAAGMPSWWFLLLLLPFLNLIASIVWCFKIVEARGKSIVWAILLLLPFTNLLAFLYLAFSSGETVGGQEYDESPLLRAA